MKKVMSILIGLIVISSLAFAEQLTGKITDSQTGEPIDRVSVYVESINLSATSNADGEYLLNFIKPALFTFVFERIGYEKKAVEHNPFDTSVLNIQLTKKPQTGYPGKNINCP